MTVLLAAPIAAAQAPRDSSEGSGESYWGPIPPREASASAQYETHSRSLWEWSLYGPYRVVGFPVQLLGLGIKGTVLGLEDSGALGKLAGLFGAYDLPYGFRVVGDVSSTVGGAVGVTFFHEELFDDNARMQLKGKLGTQGRTKVTGGVVIDRGDGESFFDLGGGYTSRDNAAFFGQGPFTDDANEAEFTREMSWVGGTYRHALGQGFALEGLGLFSTLRNRESAGPEERIDGVFTDEEPPGYGQPSDGTDVALTLLHENVDTTGRPIAGGIRRLKVGRFLANGDETSFTTYRADITQFLPLWFQRGLALRGVWAWSESSGDPIHFQRLFRFDKPDEVRGFERSRFRGPGLTFLSVEYRFPTWSYRDTQGMGIDSYVFFDWGQVFDRREEIALANLREGFGGGFRWISRDGYGGSFEVAISDETVVLRLRTDQNFQFAKHGFYHGRIPVPSY